MILRPVPGHCVNDDVPHMKLVRVERQAPDAVIISNQDLNLRTRAGRNGCRQEVAHLSGIATHTGFLELDLTKRGSTPQLYKCINKKQRDCSAP